MDFSGAVHAIELCEHLKLWDMYGATAEIEGLWVLKERMRKSAIEAMAVLDAPRKAIIQEALVEWDHPHFSLYIKAKTTGYFSPDTPVVDQL